MAVATSDNQGIGGGIATFATDIKSSVSGENFDVARMFDIREEVNAYPIFWFIIWLLAIGVLTFAIMILQQTNLNAISYNYTMLIAAASAMIVLLTTVGAIARFAFGKRWNLKSAIIVAKPQTKTIVPTIIAAPQLTKPLEQKQDISNLITAPYQGQIVPPPETKKFKEIGVK